MPIRAIFFDVGETLIDETRLLHGWADTMGVDRAEFLAVLDDIIAKGENYRVIFERLRPGFDVRAAVSRAQAKRNRFQDRGARSLCRRQAVPVRTDARRLVCRHRRQSAADGQGGARIVRP